MGWVLRQAACLWAIIGFAGCSTVPAGSLASTRPVDIRIALERNGMKGVCPGSGDQLHIAVEDASGKRWFTRGHRPRGTLSWANFNIESRGATVDPTGRLRLIPRPERLLFKPPQLTITPIHWPDRTTTLPIPVRFNCAFKAHLSGRSGRKHAAGQNGRRVRGTLSILRFRGVSYLRVVLRTADDRPEAGGSFLLNPEGGSLEIYARGGRGGKLGGRGGDGGSVELTVDPSAWPFRDRIQVVTKGGQGGADAQRGTDGPDVIWRQADVFEPL